MNRIKIIASILLLCLLCGISCKRHHSFEKDGRGNLLGNCFDGIKNQDESSVDCGGVCLTCNGCDDGVQNSGETGIDCGGKCSTCNPPTTPNNCSSLNNQTYIFMGGTSSTSVFTYFISPGTGLGTATVHFDLGTNFNNISSYDIDLGKANFAAMAIGAQRVYTTVGYDNSGVLQAGQAYVTVTQGGFSPAQYFSKPGQKIYFKKINSTQTQVWFCGLYTDDFSQSNYYFSVSAKFT